SSCDACFGAYLIPFTNGSVCNAYPSAGTCATFTCNTTGSCVLNSTDSSFCANTTCLTEICEGYITANVTGQFITQLQCPNVTNTSAVVFNEQKQWSTHYVIDPDGVIIWAKVAFSDSGRLLGELAIYEPFVTYHTFVLTQTIFLGEMPYHFHDFATTN